MVLLFRLAQTRRVPFVAVCSTSSWTTPRVVNFITILLVRSCTWTASQDFFLSLNLQLNGMIQWGPSHPCGTFKPSTEEPSYFCSSPFLLIRINNGISWGHSYPYDFEPWTKSSSLVHCQPSTQWRNPSSYTLDPSSFWPRTRHPSPPAPHSTAPDPLRVTSRTSTASVPVRSKQRSNNPEDPQPKKKQRWGDPSIHQPPVPPMKRRLS